MFRREKRSEKPTTSNTLLTHSILAKMAVVDIAKEWPKPAIGEITHWFDIDQPASFLAMRVVEAEEIIAPKILDLVKRCRAENPHGRFEIGAPPEAISPSQYSWQMLGQFCVTVFSLPPEGDHFDRVRFRFGVRYI
jgi:hypothetical protein